MNISTRDSLVGATRAQGVGLALFLALGVAAVPLAAQARAQGGHSDGSAGEASHARSEPGGDRGSWNHGGGSSGGSSGGGSTASPSGSGSSGNDGSSAQPRSGSGGDRGQWHGDRSGRGGGDHGHSRGGGHSGYGYGRGYYSNPWWGWWGWGWGWGEPYGYGGYGGGGYGRGYGDADNQGALDLDIWPGDTQVWLDGQNIGTVDDFDGFPTYLWLEKGTYDLVFYRDGYQTLARQYSIYPGLTIDVGDRLVAGPSVRPEDLPTKTHVRRDTRVGDERQRSERIDRDRGSYGDDDSNDDRAVAPSGDDEQGRLLLSIEPDDASVYLDGKFVGTAEEISRLHRGLVVDAGQHRISVVRPGRRGSEQTVTVRPGSEQEVKIQLESSGE